MGTRVGSRGLHRDTRATVEQLHEDVLASAIPDDLKEFLHRAPFDISNGIALYRIKGAAGLRETTFRTIGEIHARLHQINAEPGAVSLADRAVLLINSMYRAADAAQKAKELAAPAMPRIAQLAETLPDGM